MYYIYLTTNLINGKKYIGQHKGEKNDSYLGSGILITKAIEKYRKENFKKTILYECSTREEADKKEKEIIKQYNAVESQEYYNLQEGGIGGDGWRAYQRWAKKHPNEVKEIYKKNMERLQQWTKEHPEIQQKNKENLTKKSKKWRDEHPEEVKKNIERLNKARIKWQQEHPKEHQEQIKNFIKAGSETNSIKIKCITTNKIFNSISEAGRYYNVPQSNISQVLKGKRKSAGKLPETKEKLFWKIVK